MPDVKVLCVDDEPRVLEGLSLHLRRRFALATAPGGARGLEILQAEGPFAVVVSDMRMPGMDGATFLGKVRQIAPDTVRLLLTGQTDLAAAIAAVNEGQVFRFLQKPCPPEHLIRSLDQAVEQYRLVTAERELLEKTLRGAVKTLIDLLSITSPMAFGRATRLQILVGEMAQQLGIRDPWAVEVAATLSQLGMVTLPDEVVVKLHHGRELDEAEKVLVRRLPEITESLLAHIPRLESVRAMLALAWTGQKEGERVDPTVALCGGVLRLALDFDELDARGLPRRHAFDTLCGRSGRYPAEALSALGALRGGEMRAQEVLEISIRGVQEGMLMVEDVRTPAGMLVVARGYVATAGFVERARNFSPGFVKEPVKVVVGAPRRG